MDETPPPPHKFSAISSGIVTLKFALDIVELDTTDTDSIAKLTHRWLGENLLEVQSAAHKIMAKHYYARTEMNDIDSGKRQIHFQLKQMSQLFKASNCASLNQVKIKLRLLDTYAAKTCVKQTPLHVSLRFLKDGLATESLRETCKGGLIFMCFSSIGIL